MGQKNADKIPDDNINGLYLQSELKTVISKAKKLRIKGAQTIILLYQGGIDCTSILAHNLDIAPEKVNFLPEESGHCDITILILVAFRNHMLRMKCKSVRSSFPFF